jgi:hypothetical protein
MTFSKDEMLALHEQPCCLRASSRHGHTADCIAAMVAAKGVARKYRD